MPLLLRWLINAVALAIVAWLVPNIHLSGVVSTFLAAAIIGLLNAFIRPILLILTLPLTIITLGLFAFVVNGLMFLLAASILPGFHVYGFWSAVWGALLYSVILWIINALIAPGPKSGPQPRRRGEDDVIDLDQDSRGRWR